MWGAVGCLCGKMVVCVWCLCGSNVWYKLQCEAGGCMCGGGCDVLVVVIIGCALMVCIVVICLWW